MSKNDTPRVEGLAEELLDFLDKWPEPELITRSVLERALELVLARYRADEVNARNGIGATLKSMVRKRGFPRRF